MRIVKTLVLVAFAIVTVTTGFVGHSSAAGALDSNVCGSSYALVGLVPLIDHEGRKGGELDVYWSSSLGKNCAVTQSLGSIRGIKKYMVVAICQDSCNGVNPEDDDYGDFSYYAGPTTMAARHQCIEVQGLIENPYGSPTDPFMGGKRGWCS